MWDLGLSTPLDIYCPGHFIETYNLPDPFASPRIPDLQPFLDFVVLRRKTVAVNNRAIDSLHLTDVHQATECILVLLQFVVRELAEPEILPPGRLLLTRSE